MTAKLKDTNLTFRQAYKELEALASELDKDKENFDIDEALKKYERGHELAEFCTNTLTAMKNRVVEIKKKFRIQGENDSQMEGDI